MHSNVHIFISHSKTLIKRQSIEQQNVLNNFWNYCTIWAANQSSSRAAAAASAGRAVILISKEWQIKRMPLRLPLRLLPLNVKVAGSSDNLTAFIYHMLTLTRCTTRRMRNARWLSKRRQRFQLWWWFRTRWLAWTPTINQLKLSVFFFNFILYVFFCLLLCDLFQSIVGFFSVAWVA